MMLQRMTFLTITSKGTFYFLYINYLYLDRVAVAIATQQFIPTKTHIEGWNKRPLRHNVYHDDDLSSHTCAEWTEIASPLASIPNSELVNDLANKTIKNYSHLFEVHTPINVERFEHLLKNHPNPLFVNSVVNGFRNGFWPWADTHIGDYPDTVDESLGDPKGINELKFICEQCDKEITSGRFSESFGEELLPGMYSMPIHVVPKPHSIDFQLVTNQSPRDHSLNSMIHCEDIMGYPLDNMTHLGEMLLRKKGAFPNEKLVLFKSDIAEAYQLLPMHPLWKIKQINTIQGQWHVDHRNCFGGKISDLASYSDNSFGVELMSDFAFYKPYQCSLPAGQVTLLELWDESGISHKEKEKKQVFGSQLTIIGINVDADRMLLTLPHENRKDLLAHLKEFIRTPEKNGVKYSLKAFQCLAGWFNWALNVYALLWPALSNVYAKMAHAKPDKPLTKLYVNNAIRLDLLWAVDHLCRLPGTRILESMDWDINSADVTVYCDASWQGLGSGSLTPVWVSGLLSLEIHRLAQFFTLKL